MNPDGELLRLVCLSIKDTLKDAEIASILSSDQLRVGRIEYAYKVGQCPNNALDPFGREMFEKRGKLKFGRCFGLLVQFPSLDSQ